LRDHSFARDYADCSANSFPNTATHPSTDAAANAASAAANAASAAANAASAGGPSRTR